MVMVWCKSCRHPAEADMQKMIDAGVGDVPLTRLRFRCSNCRSSLTDFVCTARTAFRYSPGSAPEEQAGAVQARKATPSWPRFHGGPAEAGGGGPCRSPGSRFRCTKCGT